MTATSTIPDFCQGIKYFGASLPEFDKYAGKAAIAEGKTAIIAANDPNAIYQTLLAADALRYLTLQITAPKNRDIPAVLPALPTYCLFDDVRPEKYFHRSGPSCPRFL